MKDYLDNEVIYTVCTIENLDSRVSPYGGYKPKDKEKRFSCSDIYDYLTKRQSSRTPGYFLKLEDAIECIENNYGDIYEGSYKHVVIEAMGEGLYGGANIGANEEIWFEWTGSWDEGGYERIDKPECTKSIVNWGLG